MTSLQHKPAKKLNGGVGNEKRKALPQPGAQWLWTERIYAKHQETLCEL